MRSPTIGVASLVALLTALSVPGHATVQIISASPSPSPPELIGVSVSWTVMATDTNPGPLTFQFNVAAPQGPFRLARDFNIGSLAGGTWTAPPFAWTPTGVEGTYQIQVIAKDFTSGESASQIVTYQVRPLVTGHNPVVVPTPHPLVALFSAPSCAAGSTMSVTFQQRSKKTPPSQTNWVNCHPPATMTFEIGGMYPKATYDMYAQTNTGGTIVNGPAVSFTTRSLPVGVPNSRPSSRPGPKPIPRIRCCCTTSST
jgi:hypothetical protein